MTNKLALAEIIRIAAEALAGDDEEEGEEGETEESEDGMQAEAPEAEEVRSTALRIKAARDGRPAPGMMGGE